MLGPAQLRGPRAPRDQRFEGCGVRVSATEARSSRVAVTCGPTSAGCLRPPACTGDVVPLLAGWRSRARGSVARLREGLTRARTMTKTMTKRLLYMCNMFNM